jgi:hypothetical protein
MKRATDDLTVAMAREASAARKATVEHARTAAQSRGANGARQIIGGVGRGLGGAVGQAGSALGGAGVGGIVAAGLYTTMRVIENIDARRVELAKNMLENQQKIAEITRKAREQAATGAASSFRANRQSIEQVVSRFGPEGLQRVRNMQEQGFEDAPKAVIALEKFREDQKRNVMLIAQAVSRQGGGNLSEIIESITPGMARRAGGNINEAANLVFRQRMGFAPSEQQREALSDDIYGTSRGQIQRPFGSVSRSRELAGIVSSRQFSSALDEGKVETALRAELSAIADPVAVAMVELNRANEMQRQALEAAAKAQNGFARFWKDLAGNRGSAQAQLNMFNEALPMVTP